VANGQGTYGGLCSAGRESSGEGILLKEPAAGGFAASSGFDRMPALAAAEEATRTDPDPHMEAAVSEGETSGHFNQELERREEGSEEETIRHSAGCTALTSEPVTVHECGRPEQFVLHDSDDDAAASDGGPGSSLVKH
jgi:hypothetical protein